MAEGFVIDHSHAVNVVSEWNEGAPIVGFWTGLKVKDPLKITTYRCTRCGYLESYAFKQEIAAEPFRKF